MTSTIATPSMTSTNNGLAPLPPIPLQIPENVLQSISSTNFLSSTSNQSSMNGHHPHSHSRSSSPSQHQTNMIVPQQLSISESTTNNMMITQSSNSRSSTPNSNLSHHSAHNRNNKRSHEDFIDTQPLKRRKLEISSSGSTLPICQETQVNDNSNNHDSSRSSSNAPIQSLPKSSNSDTITTTQQSSSSANINDHNASLNQFFTELFNGNNNVSSSTTNGGNTNNQEQVMNNLTLSIPNFVSTNNVANLEISATNNNPNNNGHPVNLNINNNNTNASDIISNDGNVNGNINNMNVINNNVTDNNNNNGSNSNINSNSISSQPQDDNFLNYTVEQLEDIIIEHQKKKQTKIQFKQQVQELLSQTIREEKDIDQEIEAVQALIAIKRSGQNQSVSTPQSSRSQSQVANINGFKMSSSKKPITPPLPLPIPQFNNIPQFNTTNNNQSSVTSDNTLNIRRVSNIQPKLSCFNINMPSSSSSSKKAAIPIMSSSDEWSAVLTPEDYKQRIPGHSDNRAVMEYKGYTRDNIIEAIGQIQPRSNMNQQQQWLLCDLMVQLSFKDGLQTRPDSIIYNPRPVNTQINNNQSMQPLMHHHNFSISSISPKMRRSVSADSKFFKIDPDICLTMNLKSNKTMNGFSAMINASINLGDDDGNNNRIRIGCPTLTETESIMSPSKSPSKSKSNTPKTNNNTHSKKESSFPSPNDTNNNSNHNNNDDTNHNNNNNDDTMPTLEIGAGTGIEGASSTGGSSSCSIMSASSSNSSSSTSSDDDEEEDDDDDSEDIDIANNNNNTNNKSNEEKGKKDDKKTNDNDNDNNNDNDVDMK